LREVELVGGTRDVLAVLEDVQQREVFLIHDATFPKREQQKNNS
jgi:hypothetical protein